VRRAGRQELLVTEATLALLGPAGERLRRRALPAPFRRSFVLGNLRLELVPTGYLPGAAALLCEVEGRRVLYSGTFRSGSPALGAEAALVRRADAVCLDATFGHPQFSFPPPAEALAAGRHLRARRARLRGRAPVLLAPPYWAAMDVAAALAGEGIGLRGHRALVTASAAFRAAGVEAPIVARFERKLGPREALLWPPERREAPILGVLENATFAFVSGFSLDPELRARMRADAAIPSPISPATPISWRTSRRRARARWRWRAASASGSPRILRGRGYDAYALGPPRQMELFRG
jgi:hypothetical protein